MTEKPVEIFPYNPEWPVQFAQIAAKVQAGLGSLALRVDHIGSTSVPGLASKDIIDVQVSVARFDDALTEAFAAIGYSLIPDVSSDHRPPGANGPDSDWEKRYFDPPPGQRTTHMHVRILGRANQRYALLFRDYLRAHPAAASGYEAFKRILAQHHRENRRAYTTIKDPVCDIIMSAAQEWSEATNWQGWK